MAITTQKHLVAKSSQAETLNALFTTPDGAVTSGLYDNTVEITVSGLGRSLGHDFNDAFYLFADGAGHPIGPVNDADYYQTTFGTTTLVGGDPAQDIKNFLVKNFLVGPLPAYNSTHTYTFDINTGVTTPTHLHFGVSDGNFADNSGLYTVRVAQVPEASAPYVDVSTGLDSSGNIQHKGGSLDANWTVTGASNPFDPPNAYVVNKASADWGHGPPAWVANGPYSSWIAANPFAENGNGPMMTFTNKFYVATPSTAVIIGGAWTADDQGTLSLNGHLLSTLRIGDWTHLHAFSTTASDFVAGWNTLTMHVPTDSFDDGARLRGWLVGAGSAVGDPTSHIATGAMTDPSPALSSLLPPILGAETYTGGLAHHPDGNLGGARDAWGIGVGWEGSLGHGSGSGS
jgi:hypothetical protein